MTRYNKDFKEQALKLSDDIGLKKASEQLGLKYNTVAGWRQKRNNQNKNQVYTVPLTEKEQKIQLEIQELKQANEILKDVLDFFAKDRKK